ncbi:YdcF family protein [Enterococcus alcedinis]|uniref:Membrane protein n=1 Tax=Enterococcus alcedinis TaxID=1274384 RepID=A0A917JEG0_9ENTE|nr:YdcF family protein [Enterococcus alcedinis]MBP2101230.1 uncharacterized SAM-binding protein YcdF (DUF218 family) [Enterococcus alcedinis]GGI64470.1 membrane protein [Enterococcus alcedinis]
MQSLFFLLVFFVGFLFIYQRQRKKSDSQYLVPLGTWSVTFLIVYLSIIEIQNHSFYIGVILAMLLLIYLNYKRDKTRLINGFLFNVWFVSFGIYLGFHFLQTRDVIVLGLLIILMIFVFGFALFGLISLIILLYWNSLIVLKREGRSLGNLLTLILALVLTVILIFNLFLVNKLPEYIVYLFSILPFSLTYFSFFFLNFLTISLIYQLNRPKLKQDFVIVLGAGLINGERVTPLLARRIDRALDFYHRQLQQTGHPIKIILSGGQGPDEKVSEAFAMKQYALAQGIPDTDLLLEDQSTSTETNMAFSKKIIESYSFTTPKVIFASNNYHIFRAGIFARQNQLRADGIGAKTALYYLPNAFLREFIAIIALHRKKHFIFLGLVTIFLLLMAILSFIILK